MARARVRLDRAGVKSLLGDPGIRAELTRHAEAVARAAGSDVVVQQVTTGGYRAVAQAADVEAGAIVREARTGRLLRALDAA